MALAGSSEKAVGSSCLFRVLAIFRRVSRRALIFRPRNQPDLGGDIVDIHQQQIADGIKRRAAPIHPPTFPNDQHAPQTWRRKNPLVPQRLKTFFAFFAVGGVDSPRCVSGQFLRHEGRPAQRNGLRRRCYFTGHVALRHRSLFDGEKRFAGVAVQDVEIPFCFPEQEPEHRGHSVSKWPAAAATRCHNPTDHDEQVESPTQLRQSPRAKPRWSSPTYCPPDAGRHNNPGWRCRSEQISNDALDPPP